jgi:hypothetical protein
MKQPNPRTCRNRTPRSQSTVPKIKVEITGADDPTRVAIQSAIVRALEPFTRGSVNASYEIASEIVD